MFDYCTRRLGYSSSAASRRIQSARCIRAYPEIHGLLEKNEVNLRTISFVASILTEANAKDLIPRSATSPRGRSKQSSRNTTRLSRCGTGRGRCSWRPRNMRNHNGLPPNSGHCCPIPPTAGSEKTPNTRSSRGLTPAGPPQASTDLQALLQASTQSPEGTRQRRRPTSSASFSFSFSRASAS